MERSIAKPLSGPEIIDAICFKIRENLSKNCLLSPHQAYYAFSFDAKVDIHFNAPTSVVKEAQGFAKGSDGTPDPDAKNLDDTSITHGEEQPPNEVRRATEQGVPVLVDTPTGGVKERKLKYARKSNAS